MYRTLALAVAASAAVAAAPASANTVSITGGGSLSCNGSAISACVGITGGGAPAAPSGPGTLSATTADRYVGTPNTVAATAARLNTLAGTAFTGTGVGFNGSDLGTSATFTTLAQWVVLRIGNDNVFLKNTAGAAVTYVLAGVNGLNSVRVFGEVPLPAASWLMMAGLGGLAAARGRKKPA